MTNAEISEVFSKVADLLEIEGANPFRVRAYRNAARMISGMPQSMADLLEQGEDLSKLPSIGKDLAQKIADLVQTGHLPLLDEMERNTPAGLTEMLRIEGLGPKRVHQLYENLGIRNIKTLAAAAKKGRLRNLPGFGAKSEKKILHALGAHRELERRTKRIRAEDTAAPLLAYLGAAKGVVRVVIAGSYRRRQETVGDLDILVTCAQGSRVADDFIAYEDVAEVVSHGKTRCTIMLRNGLQVDLRVVADESYGAALHYFTGSKAHNIAVRRLAVAKGLKINEYGVYRGRKRLGGRTEAEVFRSVGLPYIEPELRQGKGEIDAARQGKLPKLIAQPDIRGDLHAHSKASDGRNSIAEMAEAAKAKGYRYLAITDHSKRVTIAHGLNRERLARQIKEIDRLNVKLRGFVVLKSSEVDILEDGSLDLPNAILKELDFTVCAIHSKFHLSRSQQTKRIIRAMDHPNFTILAHPTGRLIGERPAYELDMARVMQAALERGCILEINAQPDRLDLTAEHCRMAKDLGVKLVISTDAHSITDLDFMRFGVDQARCGWLEPKDVVNTRPLDALKKLLRRI